MENNQLQSENEGMFPLRFPDRNFDVTYSKLKYELQSKQSRLENALKLLVKQTSAYGKRRQQSNHDEKEDLDEPVINPINDRRHHINSSGKENYSLQNTKYFILNTNL